jgi:hypothetical protein
MHKSINLVIGRDLNERAIDDRHNQTSNQYIHLFEIRPFRAEHPNNIARIDRFCCRGEENTKPRSW